ncbi:MAG: NADH-quinone oxidoreductase subunit N [Saprospiraceae bacterium]
MTALLILFFTALVTLFAGLSKSKTALQPIVLTGCALAIGSLAFDLYDYQGSLQRWADLSNMLRFDSFSLSFGLVSVISSFLIIALSGYAFRDLNQSLGDNYGLILFSICGALCMLSFTNIVMLFLGIEILSIPLYVLAGSRRSQPKGNEAALKYFLMGAFATGILLFGITLVYGNTASFDLASISRSIENGVSSPIMLHVGIALIMIGLSFKVSAAPFHFWAPDVYTGSPSLVTSFMATVVKTAGFAAFFRLFSTAFASVESTWSFPLAIIAALTMTLANTTALFQSNFKRLMAYSSVAHAGYLLLAILAIDNAGAGNALMFYLLTYSIATICAFGVFILVSGQKRDNSIEAFNGLGKTNPFLAAVVSVSLLSLAGIPPLAGFFGKYFLFTVVFEKYPWLVTLAVINSAISIYYYFKIIAAAYFTKAETELENEKVVVSTGVRWAAIIGLVLMIMLTIMPGSVYTLM